jgi:hypothetical protein
VATVRIRCIMSTTAVERCGKRLPAHPAARLGPIARNSQVVSRLQLAEHTLKDDPRITGEGRSPDAALTLQPDM